MGTDKAWLKFNGEPLLVHLVRRMFTVFSEVIVVAAPGQDLPRVSARIVSDGRPDEGPVAGLEAGLREITHPLAFVAACDAPFLNPTVGAYLARLCTEADDAVVPHWQGRLQPLHAVYRTSARPVIEDRLAGGHRRVMDLLGRLRTRILTEEEIREADPSGLTFLNMNSPDDYQHAQKLWRERMGIN